MKLLKSKVKNSWEDFIDFEIKYMYDSYTIVITYIFYDESNLTHLEIKRTKKQAFKFIKSIEPLLFMGYRPDIAHKILEHPLDDMDIYSYNKWNEKDGFTIKAKEYGLPYIEKLPSSLTNWFGWLFYKLKLKINSKIRKPV